MSTTTSLGLRAKLRAVLRRVARALFAPEEGLIVTWWAGMLASLLVFGPLVGNTIVMGSVTLLLLLMFAVAAYMPPSRPFREMSELAARTADLIRVASSAALFGAAAVYGGFVGAIMNQLPPGNAMSADVTWSVIWPVVVAATTVGTSVVGVRLGWGFRRSGHRERLLALGKLRSWIPAAEMRRHPVIYWLAGIVITCSRTGFFMFLGYLTPVIIACDVYLGTEYAKLGS